MDFKFDANQTFQLEAVVSVSHLFADQPCQANALAIVAFFIYPDVALDDTLATNIALNYRLKTV